MKAGKLQARIQIERLQEVVADNGMVRKVWLPLLLTRAEIKQASTDEYLTGPGEVDLNRAVFLIRYPMQDIQTSDRITYAGRFWNITGLQEIGRRKALEIRVVAA